MKSNKGIAFSHSKKNFHWDTTVSPGPANYEIEQAFKYFAPNVQKGSFSKQRKGYWPEQQPHAEAPGPIYRPSKHFVSKII